MICRVYTIYVNTTKRRFHPECSIQEYKKRLLPFQLLANFANLVTLFIAYLLNLESDEKPLGKVEDEEKEGDLTTWFSESQHLWLHLQSMLQYFNQIFND